MKCDFLRSGVVQRLAWPNHLAGFLLDSRESSSHQSTVPFSITDFSSLTFRVAASVVLNYLPADIRVIQSYNGFVHHLKTFKLYSHF